MHIILPATLIHGLHCVRISSLTTRACLPICVIIFREDYLLPPATSYARTYPRPALTAWLPRRLADARASNRIQGRRVAQKNQLVIELKNSFTDGQALYSAVFLAASPTITP